MRLGFSLALLLAAAGSSRGGCGGGRHPSDPCAGKACGDACSTCPPGAYCPATAIATVCDPAGRCVPHVDGLCSGSDRACLDKACGDTCTDGCGGSPGPLCPAYEGVCDGDGRCQAPGSPQPITCVPPPVPVASCTGEACGVPCVVPCPPGVACAAAKGTCDGFGLCDARVRTVLECRGVNPAPSWGCGGKGCGDACGYCPPGVDPSQCPVATLEPTECDGWLQCVNAGMFVCPADPCAGRACGASCDPCNGLCAVPYASACDASGACVPVPARCGP